MFNAYNIVAYQVAWFACVLGAASGVSWLGTLAALAVAFVHLALVRDSRAEARLMIAVALIGLLLDTALIQGGVIRFETGNVVEGLPPHFMVALWIAFATTLNYSLRWLIAKPVVATLAGAVGGPLAYYAGMKLGALQIKSAPLALPAIGLAWAAAMGALAILAAQPAALRWSKRCERSSHYPSP